jgi:hypothetical protein
VVGFTYIVIVDLQTSRVVGQDTLSTVDYAEMMMHKMDEDPKPIQSTLRD